MTLRSDGATAIAPTEAMVDLPSVMFCHDTPAFVGLPYAAVHRAEVEGALLHGIASDRHRAAAAERADEAPLQRRAARGRDEARIAESGAGAAAAFAVAAGAFLFALPCASAGMR